jgi:hypothetical protein
MACYTPSRMALTEIDAVRGQDCLHARQIMAYSFSGTQINSTDHATTSFSLLENVHKHPSLPPSPVYPLSSNLIYLPAIHSLPQEQKSESRRNASPFRRNKA